MELFKQVTTYDQSKALVDYKINKDTASLKWAKFPNGWGIVTDSLVHDEEMPCWTNTDIADYISDSLTSVWWEENKMLQCADLRVDSNQYVAIINMEDENIDDILFIKHRLLRDNLFDCFCWLKDHNFI